MDIRQRSAALEVWIDGRFLRRLPLDVAGAELRMEPSETAAILKVETVRDPETRRFLPLDISSNRHQGDTSLDGLSTSPDAEFPIHAVPTKQQVDVGLARWLRQSEDSANFYDPYYKRSAWDNLPETIIFSVPKRFYHTAHILCAVDPDESPTMAVRIGRYRRKWDGSGASQGDTNVRIDPKNPEGIRTIKQAGTVEVERDGKKRAVPVYLIAVPLETGRVADYLQWKGLYNGSEDWGEPLDSFMLELTRTLHTRVIVNSGIFEKKPLGPRSGIHVLGITLEKSPVEILVASDEPGYSFYKNEKPALEIRTTNPGEQVETVRMTAILTDVDGKERRVSKRLEVPVGKSVAPFDLSGLGLGWRQADFQFRDLQGREIWRQRLTFALLPPDTRQAGAESPFGIWWFMGSHYTEPHADRVLPIVKKLGFRHVSPPRSHKLNAERAITPETFARYGVTPSMCPKLREDPVKEAAEFFATWPDTQYAMIFHETNLKGLEKGIPYELSGGDPVVIPEEHDHVFGGRKRVTSLRKRAAECARALRAAKPDVKIILGNGGTPFNLFWVRDKLPRSVWDCVGMEMAIQLFHPEEQPTGWNVQSLWLAKEMKKRYGYADMPTAHCYEVDYRATAPGGLSLERQAAWYARDALHALAYGLPTISVGLLADCNSSYYSSRWGSAGVCFRSPLHQPKPSFVALATLTQALDRAQYVRWLDTGSTGAYCLEFKRGDRFIYALWAGRGTREIVVKGAGDPLAGVDSMGRELAIQHDKGSARLTVGEMPCYVVAKSPFGGVTCGAAKFDNSAIAKPVVVEPMTDVKAWKIVSAPEPAFENYCGYKPLVRGDVSLSAGPERSLRLTLKGPSKAPDLAGRYVVLEPTSGPIAVAGKPDAVGVWVKGNANWGRVYFELEDAKGRRWTSNGWQESPSPGGWDMSDWENETAINHDGWRLVSVKLPALYPSGYYTPSYRDWRCQSGSRKGDLPTFPIRLARLYVVMRSQLVYVTDRVKAKSLSIEVRDLCVGKRPEGSASR
ncbi:hypothetical protein HQ560_07830 [bacterium]|nr:hypothetical protein [bacterium]